MTLDLIPRSPDPIVLDGTLKAAFGPPLIKGEVIVLAWVDEERIPAAHRAYVRRHADRAAARHHLGHIEVRWFEPADEQAVGKVMRYATIAAFQERGVSIEQPLSAANAIGDNFYFHAEKDGEVPGGVTHAKWPMTIGINAHLRGPMVKAIVAHEVRHVAQQEALTRLSDAAAQETDAEAFALAYVSQEAD